ncbi:MAG: hypothetical protein WC551_00845 [Patescibacteria group bacterium]
MGEQHPPYMLAWTGSFPEVQSLPKAMRRVLQSALTVDRDDPAKFLVSMGRLLRFCDIGTPCRRRAYRASAAVLSDIRNVRRCLDHSLAISRIFSDAFRAVRYKERDGAEKIASPGTAVILARDDLESLWQGVRRGVPIPDIVRDPVLYGSLRDLRRELEDHIQMVDALHDDSLDGLLAHDLAKHHPIDGCEFFPDLCEAEPVRWWLAVYRFNARQA